MDVAGEAAAPAPGLAAHQQRNVGKPGIERAQQRRQLEVAEPARKAAGERIANAALRERERPRQALGAARELAHPPAQQGRLGRVGEQLGVERVEEPPCGGELAAFPDQQPGRADRAGPLAMRELELGLERRREPQQHDVGRLGACEYGIAGRAEQRIARGRRQARERRADARVAMHDPEPGHGVQPAPGGASAARLAVSRADSSRHCERQSLCQTSPSGRQLADARASGRPPSGNAPARAANGRRSRGAAPPASEHSR